MCVMVVQGEGFDYPATGGLLVRTPAQSLCPWARHFARLTCWWWSEGLMVLIEWQPCLCSAPPSVVWKDEWLDKALFICRLFTFYVGFSCRKLWSDLMLNKILVTLKYKIICSMSFYKICAVDSFFRLCTTISFIVLAHQSVVMT